MLPLVEVGYASSGKVGTKFDRPSDVIGDKKLNLALKL